MGSQKCTVVYVKGWDTGWECEVNCDCLKAGFTEKMNEFCTSLGDCGAYTNIAGEVTDDGYAVTRAPKLSETYLKSLSKFAETVSGQKAEPGNLSELYGGIDALSGKAGGDYKLGNALGVGGIGLALSSYSMYAAGGGYLGVTDSIVSAVQYGGVNTLGAFGNALGAIGGAMAVASVLSGAFGMDYNDALATSFGILGGAIVTVAIIQGGLAAAYSLSALFSALMSIGPYGVIIAILVWLYTEIVGVGDTKKKTVTFECLPWQPPFGGENCDMCNENERCSEYKCKSLGQACQLLNKGTKEQKCASIDLRDVSSPRISPLYGFITEGFEYSNAQSNGFELKEVGGDCIPEFTNVFFGIETDKPAQCKIGVDPLETYEEMSMYFGGSNLYLNNHTNVLVIPSIESLKNEYNLTPIQVNKLGEFNFYVKCRGINGKENDAAYVIKSCVKEGPDITAPIITKAEPEKGYIAFNATELKAAFWTNEPAECKYGLIDMKYSEMENSMVCQNSLSDIGLYGFPCNVTFNVSNNMDKFFIKCQDLSENKNTMTESYIYELVHSESELRIVLTEPENGEIIRAKSEPATVNLEVVTAGGAEDGKAVCSYKFRENAQYAKFLETSSDKHIQIFNSVMGGEYTAWIECIDIAENIANISINFTVYVDADGPLVTRIYYQNGLKIATDEESTCAYSLVDSNCLFDINNITEKSNAELMAGTGKEHTAEWQAEQTYYIKCMDDYGNQPGRCSIIARPYEILEKSGT